MKLLFLYGPPAAGKLTVVREIFAESDLYGAVPYSNNLTVNNTNITPADVANQVIDYFKLHAKTP